MIQKKIQMTLLVHSRGYDNMLETEEEMNANLFERIFYLIFQNISHRLQN